MRLLENIWSKHYSKCLLVCYWVIGLCNNFAYVVMLSAAHDILANHDNKTTPSDNSTNNHTNKYNCNPTSTGAVLLADILPGIIIKLLAPFFVHKLKYPVRVSLAIMTSAMSFSLVALAPSDMKWLAFMGVVCASLSSSFGEITFLSLSTLYGETAALAGWGSGTGAAGLGASLSYAGLTSAGVSPRTAILMMLIVPVLMAVSYVFLPPPQYSAFYKPDSDTAAFASDDESEDKLRRPINAPPTSCGDQRFNLRPLLKYMIPLFLVYWAEYFINQGLYELLYFRGSFIKKHEDQYRWYNVCYQTGVFISRSSISFFQIKFLAIFPVLQILNVAIVLTQVFLGYMDSIWWVFLLILWEGLLGGGCYVNAFHLVSIEIPKGMREFSIAITSVADSLGITLSGFTAIPVHNAICKYGDNRM